MTPAAAPLAEEKEPGAPRPVRLASAAGPGAAWSARRQVARLPIRSVERRRWSADLLDSATAGLIVHGIGGIGKSVLAAEIAERAARLEPERMTAVVSGEVSADDFLGALAEALRAHPDASLWGGLRAEAVSAADQTDLPADYRLGLLRAYVLGQAPVLIGLDDFDANLAPDGDGWAIRDPDLAGLLASWACGSQRGRLLITCRHPFSLPGGAEQALGFRRLGPLTREGAVGLAGSLHGLRQLDEAEFDRAWRLLGGHPRAMEYLDALLQPGHERFADVARRLEAAILAGTGGPAVQPDPAAPAVLPPVAAEATALAACDLLLGDLCGRLSAGARELLLGASVYRAPIGCHDALLPVGRQPESAESAEFADLVAGCESAGLLTADRGSTPPTVFVHRWTAHELHRRLAEAGRDAEVTDAHRRAAGYWRRRITISPQDRRALLEANHHLREAGDQDHADRPATGRAAAAAGRRRLLCLTAATVAVAIVASVLLAIQATGRTPARKLAARHPASPSGAQATIRREAAAWIAKQVARGAVVACDPAMCSALQAQRIAAGSLQALSPSAPDPLPSDVVVATPAVRSQFGARLASVYAPVVLATFGSGGTRIEVRAVALDGAAAYLAKLGPDLAARRHAGAQLLRNARISVTPAARHQLLAGLVDSRLLLTLATVAAFYPVRVAAFTDGGPGPNVPLRTVELVPPRGHGTGGIAVLRRILVFARVQRPPYLALRAGITRAAAGGAPVLSVEFGAPSPPGLLGTQPGHPAGRIPAASHRNHQ
jgi:hypothetical protein